MKNIIILVPEGPLVLSSIVGPYKIFNKINEYLIATNQRTSDYYNVKLAGTKLDKVLYDGAFSIRCDSKIQDVKEADLIIIPSFTPSAEVGFEEMVKINQPTINWIQQQHKQEVEVASLCTGALLLAATGIVDGKQCSTHWMAEEVFRTMYPNVNLVPENIISEENGVYSSGGAYSFLNLILHLVEKFTGRESAIWASKVFEIEIDRVSQSQFTIFNTQKQHDDEPIQKAQSYIETNFDQKVSVEQLADICALSRRNFVRRFKKATSNTPLEYIQRVKMEAAKKSFETDNINVNEVMYAVGYNDNKAFRNIFKKITGLSPLEYKSKYYRMAMA